MQKERTPITDNAQEETIKTTTNETKLFNSPELTNNIRWLKHALMPLEFSCLILLIKNQTPTSTGGIYAQILKLLYSRHDKEAYWNRGKNPDLREVERELRVQDIYFPAYSKVQNTLEQLEKAGLIARRDMEGTREKFLWMVSSAFYLKHGKAFESAFLKTVAIREKGTGAKRHILTEIYPLQI